MKNSHLHYILKLFILKINVSQCSQSVLHIGTLMSGLNILIWTDEMILDCFCGSFWRVQESLSSVSPCEIICYRGVTSLNWHW